MSSEEYRDISDEKANEAIEYAYNKSGVAAALVRSLGEVRQNLTEAEETLGELESQKELAENVHREQVERVITFRKEFVRLETELTEYSRSLAEYGDKAKRAFDDASQELGRLPEEKNPSPDVYQSQVLLVEALNGALEVLRSELGVISDMELGKK